jgi:methionyl-tRNA synthetase
LSFIAKNCGGQLQPDGKSDPADAALLELVRAALADEMSRHFDALALSQGCEAWLRAVFACNQYIDAQAPWTLRKTDPERMNAVLATLLEALRMLGVAIQPVIPASAARLLDQLGVPAEQRSWAQLAETGDPSGATIAPPQPIFPRLEAPAEG